MADKVNVTIPVAPEVAEALQDPQMLLKASAMISVLLHPRSADDLRAAMGDAAREWREAGMTDADLEEELAAHKRERTR